MLAICADLNGKCAELKDKRRDFYNMNLYHQISNLYDVIFHIIDVITYFKLFKRNPERNSVILKTRATRRGKSTCYCTWCDNAYKYDMNKNTHLHGLKTC